MGPVSQYKNQICAILFADIVGSSSVSDEVQKANLNKFIRTIVGEGERCCSLIIAKTMGDGFLLCGTDPCQIAEFSLNVRDRFKNNNWVRLGYQKPLAIRVGLELGTVTLVEDDLGNVDISGKAVERAARIEPITPPNTIWVSDYYANHLSREVMPNIFLRSLGEKKLAKEAGILNLYELRWASEVEHFDSVEVSDASMPLGDLPKIRRDFSDMERDRFLITAFRDIQDFFDRSLSALKKQEANLIETDIEKISSTKFIASIHVNGKTRCRCKIWIGGKRFFGNRNREIGYVSGDFDTQDDSSYNESLSVSDDGYVLYLQALGIFVRGDEDTLSAMEAAKKLWKNFIREIE